MYQRKKNQNKQNFKTIKKTTVQQINYTQQLHIPTYATMDLRQAGRSIELKKSSSKKPVSRKSRCISVKQSGQQAPLNIKQLLKQIKSMKLIRSRSRSPRSSKSKQKSKKSTKKITQTQVNSKSNSQLNLTAKLQRTIQKLKQQNYFKDEEDSQIPLISTSQAFTQQQKKKLEYIISGQNFDDINIREMRLFCKNKQPGIKISLDYFKGNIYEIMARRIQRAWRRYRTHKLVQRYASLINLATQQQMSPQISPHNSSVQHQNNRQQIMISSQQLYPEQMIQRKITYISNLEQESDEQEQKNQQQDSTLYHLKKQQLQKWSQIIQIINSNRTQNKQQTQKLLRKLINKSQTNRRNLQLRPVQNKEQQSYQDHDNNYNNTQQNQNQQQQKQQNTKKQQYNIKYIQSKRKQQSKNKQKQKLKSQQQTQLQIQKLKKKLQQQKSNVSQDSIKQIQEQFNSKKYIQYLDSDMYPITNHHHYNNNNNNKQSITTINKKKQDILLDKLQGENSMKRLIKGSKILGNLGNDVFQLQGQIPSRLSYRSNSQFSSANSIQAQQLKSSRKISSKRNKKILFTTQIRRSVSQKNIKYSTYDNLINKIKQQKQQQKQQKQKLPSQKQLHQQICIHEQQLQDIQNNQYKYKYETPNQKQYKQRDKQFIKQIRRQMKILKLPQKPRKSVQQDLQCIMRRQLQQEIQQDSYQFIQQHPLSQNQNKLQKAYLQDQFKKKIGQLHRIRQQNSDEQPEHKIQTQMEPVLHRTTYNQLHKVNVQDYDHNIESDQDNSQNGLAQKGEAISQMLTNSLALQFLIQIAKYPQTILKQFKNVATKRPKIKRAPNKPKKNGFPTNQAEIKGFIEQLTTYVINDQPQIFKNLQKATGPSALQMLRYMHQSVENDIYIQEQEDDPSIMILPNWVFQTFWSRKQQTIKYQRQGLDQQRQKQRQNYLKGLNKIFLRSCFDCLNQCLDYERNYGPFGKPFPWKRSHYFDHVKQLEQTKKSVANSQKRLFDISSTYCGIIIQKQQIASLGGNQDYISQVQQDRLSRMLAQDLVQGQQRWIFYDDEETELLVEASNTIFHQILQQVMVQLRILNSSYYFF